MRISFYSTSPINFKRQQKLISPRETAEILCRNFYYESEDKKQENILIYQDEFKKQNLSPQQIDKLAKRLLVWKQAQIKTNELQKLLSLPEFLFSGEKAKVYQNKLAQFTPNLHLSYSECLELYNLPNQAVDVCKQVRKKDNDLFLFDAAKAYATQILNTEKTLKMLRESDFKKDLCEIQEHIKEHYFTHDTENNSQMLGYIAMQNDNIDDPFIKSEIKNKLEEFKNCTFKKYASCSYPLNNPQIQEIMIIQDIVNQSKNKYSVISKKYPPYQPYDYQKTIEKTAEARVNEINKRAQKLNLPLTDKDTELAKVKKRAASEKSQFAKEIANCRSTESLEDYIKNYSTKNKKMCLYLYKNYYLNKYPKEIQKRYLDIAKDFNTYVLLPTNYKDVNLKFIRKELTKWKKWGGEDAVMPHYIKISKMIDNYIRTKHAAHATWDQKIYIKSTKYIKYALRHEMIHLNTREYERDPFVDGIEKDHFNDFSESDRELFKNKKWYRSELEKTNLSLAHINYAYTNAREFLAVAGEDTSKYSDEFKEVLVRMGMPVWVFDLDK